MKCETYVIIFWSGLRTFATIRPLWGECFVVSGAQLPTLLESRSIDNHEVIIAIVKFAFITAKKAEESA